MQPGPVQVSVADVLLFGATIAAPIIATLLILHRQNVLRMNALFDLLREFPLHLHVNGKIIYPSGTVPKIVTNGGEMNKNNG